MYSIFCFRAISDSSNLFCSWSSTTSIEMFQYRFALVSVGCAYVYSNWWCMKLCRRCRAKNEIISRQNIKVYCSLAFRFFFLLSRLFLFLLLLVIVILVLRRIRYQTCLISEKVSMMRYPCGFGAGDGVEHLLVKVFRLNHKTHSDWWLNI